MKSREVPPGVLYGGIGVVLLIVLAVAYSMFMKSAPVTDPSKLTPQQLQDPDPPRTHTTAPSR